MYILLMEEFFESVKKAAEAFRQQCVIDPAADRRFTINNKAPDGLRGQLHADYKEFYGAALQHNDGLVIGDGSHGDDVKAFFAASLPIWKKDGVTDIFLEIPREFQADVNNYILTGDEKYLTHEILKGDKVIFDEVRKPGNSLAVHCMDDTIANSPATLALNKAYEEFGLQKKLDALPKKFTGNPDAGQIIAQFNHKYAKEMQAMLEERTKADGPMTDFIKQEMQGKPGKFVAMIGCDHLNNPFPENKSALPVKDFDEILADKTGKKLVRVDFNANSYSFDYMPKVYRINGFRENPFHRNFTSDEPEFVVTIPVTFATGYLNNPLIASLSEADKEQVIKNQFYFNCNNHGLSSLKEYAPEKAVELEKAGNAMQSAAAKAREFDFEAANKIISDAEKAGTFDVKILLKEKNKKDDPGYLWDVKKESLDDFKEELGKLEESYKDGRCNSGVPMKDIKPQNTLPQNIFL